MWWTTVLEGGARARHGRIVIGLLRHFRGKPNDSCNSQVTTAAPDAGDRAAYAGPNARSGDTLDEPVRLRLDPEAIRVSRSLRPSGRAVQRTPASPLGYRHSELRRGRGRELYRPEQCQGHTARWRRRMDASGTRHVARRRSRRKQAGLRAASNCPHGSHCRPSLNLAHRKQFLPGPRRRAARWPSARPPRQLWVRIQPPESPSPINYLAVA